jgi:hypothetical protein
MFVVGADFRHYMKIHRELIWANRFAASSSFGPYKLIYYLGGVDNWMGFLFNSLPMFDNTIPVDPTKVLWLSGPCNKYAGIHPKYSQRE